MNFTRLQSILLALILAALAAGLVGVGPAAAQSGDTPTVPAAVPTSAAAPTQGPDEVINPVLTATTQPDGSVVHVVEAGQSPWAIAIAYSTTIAEIARLNGLDENNPTLFPGQELLIRVAASPTAGPSLTSTPRPPTNTPRPTATRRTPRPSRTPEPTVEATATPAFSVTNWMRETNLRTAGVIITAICALGLLVTILLSIRYK